MEIIRINLGPVNCYLGKENDCFILFDTGGHTVLDRSFDNRSEQLLSRLKEEGCTPENLKLIVLTHGDCDHVGNAKRISEIYKTQIAIHKADANLVEKPEIIEIMKSFNYRKPVFKIVFKILKSRMEAITKKILDDFEVFKPDFYIDEGFSLMEYGCDAKVLHIPGHTKGSIAIVTSTGELIAGDTFANMGKPTSAPNAYDFAVLDISINRLKSMNIKTVYPGHGKPFEMTALR